MARTRIVPGPPTPNPRGGYHHYKRTAKDLKIVKNMILLGSPEATIASCLEIDPTTLKKHYSTEMRKYREEMLAKIADKAFAMALKGDKTMMIFVLKCKGGWRETEDINVKKTIIKRVIGVKDEDV